MANEKRGLIAEAIMHRALEKAVKQQGVVGQVFHNKKPSGMSVTPDLTVGQDSSDPEHVVLVTASGAEHNSHMKFMRNVGEIFEAKVQLPREAKVHSTYALSEQKEKVRNLMDLLTDSSIHIDDDGPTAYLSQWLDIPVTVNVKDRDARLAFVDNALLTDSRFQTAFDALVKTLRLSLGKTNTDLVPLWTLMREDYQQALNSLDTNPLPQPRQTFVRRGIGKLMVLDKDTRKAVYDSLKTGDVIKGDVPAYALQLGFLQRTLGGTRLQDDEIRNVIELLGPEQCEKLISSASRAMWIWINPLRNLQRLTAHVDFVRDHYDQVTDPTGLKQILQDTYTDPAKLSGEASDEKVWPYEIMVSLLKAHSGKKQGYGLAQLAKDVGKTAFGPTGSQVRFVIPPFIQRQKPLSDEQLTALATGLAKRFGDTVPRDEINGLKDAVVEAVIKENLEDRLIPYRNFEPLVNLLKQAAAVSGVTLGQKENYTGWISEYADSGKAVATTPFIRFGDTLVHWKSASDAGKGHKVKELSARARIIKYQYDPETATFSRRPEAQRLVLIIDGTFDAKDLRVLRLAGWDEIVYPDEISKILAK